MASGSRRSRRLAIGSAVGIAGIAALQLSAVSGAAVASAAARAAASTTKPDLSYFSGKTITFINGSSAGSGGDSLARPLAPYIQQYLGAAAVNVENITGSGSIAAQDTVASAPPDGLTIGELAASSNLEGYIGVTQAVNFNQLKMTMLGGTYASPGSCIYARSNAPDQTASAFLKDKAVHTLGDVVPGTTDLEARTILWAYRVPTVLVTGYTSQSNLAAGFARGDEPYATSALTAFLSNLSSGVAKCILVMGVDKKVPSYLSTFQYLNGVPNLLTLMSKEPPATAAGKKAMIELEALVATPSYDFFAPPGVQPGIALALTDAVKFAEAQTQVKETYVAQGNVPGYTTPATVISELKAINKHIAELKTPAQSIG